jgi:uncharacterized protein with PIN domain
MAKSSTSEKRLEERLVQELRDFQRAHPANKRCFDCNEMVGGVSACLTPYRVLCVD